MTQINVTDFRNNLKKYAELAQIEDLEIINRGETLFYVQGKKSKRKDAFNALIGCIDSKEKYEDILKHKVEEL